MALRKNAFQVLNHLREHPRSSQREIARSSGLSLGSVNSAMRELHAEGCIKAGFVAQAGYDALRPYRVDNAVILAAGMSSRFAPISYEKPTGLMNVKGEVLIERQIGQLRRAGIDAITVVVGYKKEFFFYLEKTYGVSILVNDEYASRNNHASLMRARDRLGNTFVCSSDDYFVENPFEPYVWKAYYAAQWSEGETKEWCLETGARNRIVAVTKGGAHAWYMLGHAYFDRAFSRRFAQILDDEYDRPETMAMLWEDLYIEHIAELDMVMRPFPPGTINEFDSLDELRVFDPMFLENVDSEIFANIESVLGCDRHEIRDVYPLKQGLTNLSCHFRSDRGEYVYRHPGVGTELLIDREAEAAAQQVAKRLQLDDSFIFEDLEKGWKISHFIPGCRSLDPHDPIEVAHAMQMARRLHGERIVVDRRFDFYDEANRYRDLLLEKGPIEIRGFTEMSQRFERLAKCARRDRAPVCLCHNDFFMLNFLIDESGKYYLIDWEYAGMSDYANDFGTFCVCCQLDEKEVSFALRSYLGRAPTVEVLRHNLASIALAGWCWYLWALLKESEGDFVGEWLYIYYDYAQSYLQRALALYEHGTER